MAVPADWDELTPEWMTEALQRDFAGAVVDAVQVVTRDDGTNRRARLGLTYRAGSGPAVVFVKGEGAYRESHARNGNMYNEPELFAARIPLPVDHPHPYHVAIDRTALDYVIVMEDITRRGGRPLDATTPLSIDQAEDGVRRLAALHGAYWDLPAVSPALEWLQTWAPTAGWRESLGPGVPVGLERAGDVVPAEVRAIGAESLLDLGMRSIGTFATGRMTLLHADPHIGNTYLLPGDQVGFLDWQVCRRGGWAQDLAYFVVSALTVPDRRRAEERLLTAYHRALAIAPEARPDMDEVRLRYAAAHPYGLVVWLATHQSDRSQRADVCRALIERFAAATADWDSAAALQRLDPAPAG